MTLVKRLEVYITQNTVNIAKFHFPYKHYTSEQRGLPF